MQIQDSFLLEEVRCGFFIPADVKQAWAADMEVLLEIDRVCRKHDIQYFADWGTLLGVVRHGGYIPWDDDLDIVMKREDYIKFITVARRDMEKGFDVRTFRNHDDNWLFMGKVINQNSFSFEKEKLRRFHNFPYIASVDVFVLDYVYRDSQKEKERRELCKYMLAAAEAIGGESCTSAERERLMLKLEERCGRRLERRADGLEQKRYLYGEVEKIFACVPKQESDGLSQLFPWGLLGTAPKFPTEYYERAVELPFEGMNMPVPFAYDKMLRQRYGDYLQPVKTGGAHDYPFFEGQRANLQKVLDFPLPEFKADRDMLCRGEREQTKKELSYKAMTRECITALWEFLKQLSNEGCNSLQAVELLQESQQLAVDLGNLLEQMPIESEGLISLLEQYCDELYTVYEQISVSEDWGQFSCKELEHIAGCLKEELERRVFSRKTVLFLPVLAKDWGSLQPLWQEAEEDEGCDVYVVPLPYYYKDYDNTPRRVCCEEKEFAKELGAADYHLLTQEYLTLLHPECIIIQNPYDEWHPSVSVPEQFYALELRKYTDELIYVPPFTLAEFGKSSEREYANMKYYVTMPGVTYADKVSVQSENMRQQYVEKLTEFAGEDTREIWERKIRCAAEELFAFGHRQPKPLGQESDVKSPAEDFGMTKERQKAVKQQSEYVRQEERSTGRENGRRLLYGISYGVYAEDKEKARAKLKSSLAVIAKSGLSAEILLYPNTAVTSELRREITDTVLPCACPMIPEGAECRAEDYSAYYGDGMPVVLQFRNAEKPVLIRDVGI